MFNTLMYAKKLEEAGVSRPQAEAHVQIMAEIVEGNLATKQDMLELRSGTSQDIQALRAATKQDIKELQSSMQQDMSEFRNSMQKDMQELRGQFHKLLQEFQTMRNEGQSSIHNLEYKIVLKLGAFITAILTIVIGAAGLWIQFSSN